MLTAASCILLHLQTNHLRLLVRRGRAAEKFEFFDVLGEIITGWIQLLVLVDILLMLYITPHLFLRFFPRVY